MSRVFRSVSIVAMLVIMSGCYHAKVTTGLTPSTVVIDQPFATGWIYGLVPPSPVEAASECPNGVAMVETELSFVNQVVSAVTFGIFTPMHIKVTCAAASGASIDVDGVQTVTIEHDRTTNDVVAAFDAAADLAVEGQAPVLVRFE